MMIYILTLYGELAIIANYITAAICRRMNNEE